MRLHLTLFVAMVFVVSFLGCGGGSDGPGGGGGGSGLTAVVDGQPWAAEPVGVTALAGGVPGGLVITGSQIAGGKSSAISISLSSITGPGTYALGVGPGVYGGSASVGEAPLSTGAGNTWQTRLDGVAGSVTITTLDPTRIAGTFQFTGEANMRNPLGGTRTVTDGRIDLPLKGKLVPVPDNIGSKVSATLGGKPYNAWSINTRVKNVMILEPGVQIDTTTKDNVISLILVGVTAPGEYALSNTAPLRTIIVGKNGGDADHCCWGLNGGGDVGTITVTSLTATRVKGTFSGTLQPQPGKPATGPLQIVDGVFDVGID